MTTDHAQTENNKLFVGNLSRGIRRQELKEYFSQWGEVAYTSVALEKDSGRSRGFWFVTFVNEEDAVKAQAEANEKELDGRTIYIDFARARDDAEQDAWEQQEEQEQQEEEQTEEQAF